MDDHDLLIELKTLMTVVLDNQTKQIQQNQELSGRVSALEAKDRGDSERIGSILEAVKATAKNADRITEAHARIDNFRTEFTGMDIALNKRMDAITDELKSFRNKSNIMDAINAAGAAIAGIIGAIFGSR